MNKGLVVLIVATFIFLCSISTAVAQTVIATITVKDGPFGVGVNPDTNRIYVTNSNNDTVSVIDGTTNTVTATINVGDGPRAVGVNPNTNKIYVANFFDDTVSVIGADVWSTDSLGNPKSTFLPGEEVYVEGNGFPPSIPYDSMTIYIIPDGGSPLPENSVASATGQTDETGALPVTLVWSPPLTTGEYDIWVDVNQDGVYDSSDTWNDQVIGVFAFNAIPEPPILIGILLMSAALVTFCLTRKRQPYLK